MTFILVWVLVSFDSYASGLAYSPPMQTLEVSSKDYIALLRDVLETNDRIVKQNALIVQSLTLPHLIIGPQGENNDL
jgi:hypothetical protein